MMLRHDLPGQAQHLLCCRGVQGRRVLVQQQQLGRDQCGHQQGKRLTLSAGQQPHGLLHPVLQPHIQQGQPVPEELLLRFAGPAEKSVLILGSAQIGQGQVLLDGHMRRRPPHGVLKQPPYFPAALVLRLEGDVLPRQADGALIHIEGPRDGVEEGGFTRAVGAHDGDEVPLLQTEGNSAQRLLLVHRSGVEGLGDTRKFQHLSVPPFSFPPSASGRQPTA